MARQHDKLSVVVIPGYYGGNEYARWVAQDAGSRFRPLWFSAEAQLQPEDESQRAGYRDGVLSMLGRAVGRAGLVVANGTDESFEKGRWRCGVGETSLAVVEAAVEAGYPAALVNRTVMEQPTGLDLVPFGMADRAQRLARLDLQIVRDL